MEIPETGQKPPTSYRSNAFFRKYKKRINPGVVFAVLFAITVGVYLLGPSKNKQETAESKLDPTQVIKTIEPKEPTSGYEKVAADADKLFVKNDFDGAIKLLETAIPRLEDPNQLFILQEKLGNNYRAKKDWANALRWYEKALALGTNNAGHLYPVIGEMAEKAGDTKKAIAAYKKAYEIAIKDKDPVFQRIAESYQAKIKSLGGQ